MSSDYVVIKAFVKSDPLLVNKLYRKNPKNSDSRKIAVIILKFEQYGSIIE